MTSTSTVGFPLESKICLACMLIMILMLFKLNMVWFRIIGLKLDL